jgi:hypothetical protein
MPKSKSKKTKRSKSKPRASLQPRQRFSFSRLSMVIAVFVILGAAVIIRSLASSGTVTIEAESMTLSKGAMIRADAKANANQSVFIYTNSKLATSFSTTAQTSSITVRAKGQPCNGAPQMTVTIDATLVLTAAVDATDWTNYSAPLSIPPGTNHTLSLAFTNDAYVPGTCDRNLYIDTTTITPQNEQYSLQMSTTPDGKNPINLNGQLVKGSIYVVTAPATSTASVDFHVDTDPAGTVYTTQKQRPYSLGGDVAGVLDPFDTTKLNDGAHYITAVITRTDGAQQTVKAVFTVQNTAPPAANLLFSDDYSSGALGMWPTVQSCPGAISVVSDPLRASGKSAKFTVTNNDTHTNCAGSPNQNPRAQLVSKPLFKNGDDQYIGFSTFFPSGFPANVPSNFLQVAEIYGAPFAGGPPLGIDVLGDKMMFASCYFAADGTTLIYNRPWISKTPNHIGTAWENITLHVKFSPDKTVGYVEIWQNGAKQTFIDGTQRYYMATLMPGISWNGSTATNSLYMNSYRHLDVIPDTITLYHDDVKVGSTFASVQP